MIKRAHRPKQSTSTRIFWAIVAIAITLAATAGAVVFSLRHQHPLPDIKVYFIFAAGLLAVLLLLIAQVWRDRMLGT
jgi:hypothetical protein